MKKLLTLFFLLCSLLSFSQITIEGNGKKISLPPGEYSLKVGKEAVEQTAPLPNCGCDTPDFRILSITQKRDDLYTLAFDACRVNPLDWKVIDENKKLVKSGSLFPQSSVIDLDFSGTVAGHNYTIVVTSANCKGKAEKQFSVGDALPVPVSSSTGAIILQPLKDPLAPTVTQSGPYEIRYLESRPDDHLDLRISEKDGQLYLSDVGNSLQTANYTLNGWSDPENPSKLENEPIQPYKRYHVVKFSIDRPTIRDVWMVEGRRPRPNFRRSELFFYVVPKGETWNPEGQSNNPIGRPVAFEKIPPFKLKNRVWGFEYEFQDETEQRLNELDITFNRKPGQQHLKLYSGLLTSFLEKLPTRKGFHDLTEKESIDFANTIPIDKILAFDIEPGDGYAWTIDYAAPNFNRNMGIVINRLKERGAMAYNWMGIPSQSPNVLNLDGVDLRIDGGFGNNNQDIPTFQKAFSNIGRIQKRENPYSVISTGFGYTSYDYNLAPDDNTTNTSPQITYLKSLTASELWKRAFPEKEQVWFCWPFMEFWVGSFPANHVVEIPEYNAVARRTDNKPLYSPTQWEDNITLGLVNSKYLFQWSPGPVGWNPANVSSYNDAYTNGGFSVWTYEKGRTPQTGKFYIGKESMAVNGTVKGVYTFSLIQDAADGSQYSPNFEYQRADKSGNIPGVKNVPEITDGSWYISSLTGKQPFCIILENGNNRAVLFQDVWARPGRFTKFQFAHNGRVYQGVTEGNRLFVAHLPY